MKSILFYLAWVACLLLSLAGFWALDLSLNLTLPSGERFLIGPAGLWFVVWLVVGLVYLALGFIGDIKDLFKLRYLRRHQVLDHYITALYYQEPVKLSNLGQKLDKMKLPVESSVWLGLASLVKAKGSTEDRRTALLQSAVDTLPVDHLMGLEARLWLNAEQDLSVHGLDEASQLISLWFRGAKGLAHYLPHPVTALWQHASEEKDLTHFEKSAWALSNQADLMVYLKKNLAKVDPLQPLDAYVDLVLAWCQLVDFEEKRLLYAKLPGTIKDEPRLVEALVKQYDEVSRDKALALLFDSLQRSYQPSLVRMVGYMADTPEAFRLLQGFAVRYPEQWVVQKALGRVAYRLKLFGQALSYFKEANNQAVLSESAQLDLAALITQTQRSLEDLKKPHLVTASYQKGHAFAGMEADEDQEIESPKKGAHENGALESEAYYPASVLRATQEIKMPPEKGR